MNGQKVLKGAAGLIVVYLAVKNGPALANLIRQGAYGSRDVIKTFQGR